MPLLMKEKETRQEGNNELKKHIKSAQWNVIFVRNLKPPRVKIVRILTEWYEQIKVGIIIYPRFLLRCLVCSFIYNNNNKP